MTRKIRAVPGWRGPFLRALAAGQSIAQAARAAGIDPSSAHHARKRDAAFAAAWAAARDKGVVRLTKGEPALATDEVVRASKDGQPRIQRAGPGRWSMGKEAAFLEELAATCNVSAACRAAGVSNAAVYTRRERWPAFAERWRSALDHGWHRLEAALVGAANAALEGEPRTGGDDRYRDREQDGGDGGGDGGGGRRRFAAAMTVDQALTLYKMHRHAVTGAGAKPRHGWRKREPTIEEVRAEVLRRVRLLGG